MTTAAFPQTLLARSGATLTPPPTPDAVLILIDCQREYVDGALPLHGVQTALEVVADLLSRARAASVPVIHVLHQGRPGGLFDPEGPGAATAPEAAPAPGECVVRKQLPNAFAGTDLLERIRATGRTRPVVAGFMTHMCVSSTVRASLDLGLFCTVVASATATRDLPAADGGVVEATSVQRASLAALADRFALVLPQTGGLWA